MKIVLQCALNELEKVLDDIEEDDVIVDQGTYCYFRDQIFIPAFKDYIIKNHPGELQDVQVIGNEGVEGAKKTFTTMRNFEVMHKYYKEYCKVRQRFHYYKGSWYVIEFFGFGNIGNEISLIQLNHDEVADLLNSQEKFFLSRIEQTRRALADITTRLRKSMHFDLSKTSVPVTPHHRGGPLTYGVVTTAVIGAWFTEALLFIMLWRWFVVPLGVADITYVHGFGLYLLWSFVKTPNYRKEQPHEESGLEYWKSYAVHSYAVVGIMFAIAWPTQILLQRFWY